MFQLCFICILDVQIYVVDMIGIGFMDLVEIFVIFVIYWFNFGYGIFGFVVEMGNLFVFVVVGDFDYVWF